MGTNHPIAIAARWELATAQCSAGAHAEEDKVLSDLLAVETAPASHCRQTLAACRLAQGKPEGVSQLMAEVITEEPDVQRVSAAYLYYALSQCVQGELAAAEIAFAAAVDASADASVEDRCHVLTTIGDYWNLFGNDTDNAEEAWSQACQLLDHIDASSSSSGYKADVLCRLGALHSDAGSFDQAQELLNDACDMADGTRSLADTLCELGRFSLKRGNAISSEGFFRGALSKCSSSVVHELRPAACTEPYAMQEYATLLKMWENRIGESEQMASRAEVGLQITGWSSMSQARLVWPVLRQDGRSSLPFCTRFDGSLNGIASPNC